jgi:thymidylate kinase
MMIPAGLSSEACHGDTKLVVQTEFALRPQPRVTTTVFIKGQVVEKMEKMWEKSPQTQEENEEIEKFLKRQHRQVLKIIKDKKEKLVPFEPEK